MQNIGLLKGTKVVTVSVCELSGRKTASGTGNPGLLTRIKIVTVSASAVRGESCALERAEDRGRFRLQVGAEEDGREAGGPWAPLEDGGDGFSCWRVKTCCFFNLNGVALAGFPSGPRISNGLSPSSMAAEAFESFESFGFELPDFMPMTMTCLGRLDNKSLR